MHWLVLFVCLVLVFPLNFRIRRRYHGYFSHYMTRNSNEVIFPRYFLEPVKSINNVMNIDKKSSQTTGVISYQTKSINRNVTALINQNDIAETLNTLQGSIKSVNNNEINYLITNAIVNLDRKRADIAVITGIISNFSGNSYVNIDSVTYTSYMDLLNRRGKYEETLNIFDDMKDKEVMCFMSAARAAGHCRPWKYSLDLLEMAYDLHKNEVAPVVYTIMTNLKYNTNYNDIYEDNLEKAKGLLTWLSSRNIPLTTQSLDIILGILTRAKEDVTTDLHEELTGILALYATYSLCPSYYTFHSLLSYYAAQGNLNKANEIIKLMKLWDYEPDTVSYNILLRLCINRISTQKVVSKELVNSIVGAIPDSNNEITQSLLIQLYTALKDEQGILKILNTTQSSPYIYSNALNAFKNDSASALRILQYAVQQGQADEAVYTATAQICYKNNDYVSTFRIIEIMLRQGLVNEYTTSLIVTVCLPGTNDKPYNDSNIVKLERYLALIKSKNSTKHLITDTVCQRVLSTLITKGHIHQAIDFHLRIFNENSVKSETLELLLTDMQYNALNNGNLTQELAVKSLALLGLYINNKRKRSIVRTCHFNGVLRLLSLANMLPHVEELYYLMAGRNTFGSASDEVVDGSTHNKTVYKWRPGTFTIAEMIRVARESKNLNFIQNIINWGIREQTYIPPGVVSDAISSVYTEGRVDMALDIYRSLYTNNYINHWSNRRDNEMDLHTYSRGMAYAAIYIALSEMKKIDSKLTIITGRSIGRSGDNNEAYKLSTEVQRCLIEDFYPPISSSTVPGNPGRLYVELKE